VRSKEETGAGSPSTSSRGSGTARRSRPNRTEPNLTTDDDYHGLPGSADRRAFLRAGDRFL
jgi:hypothetical protein